MRTLLTLLALAAVVVGCDQDAEDSGHKRDDRCIVVAVADGKVVHSIRVERGESPAEIIFTVPVGATNYRVFVIGDRVRSSLPKGSQVIGAPEGENDNGYVEVAFNGDEVVSIIGAGVELRPVHPKLIERAEQVAVPLREIDSSEVEVGWPYEGANH